MNSHKKIIAATLQPNQKAHLLSNVLQRIPWLEGSASCLVL